MTKKDYELIATVLRRNYEGAVSLGEGDAVETLEDLAFDMATALEFTSERFNSKLFLQACGVIR